MQIAKYENSENIFLEKFGENWRKILFNEKCFENIFIRVIRNRKVKIRPQRFIVLPWQLIIKNK